MGARFVFLEKRKKRSVRNEGIIVKNRKIMWDEESYVRAEVNSGMMNGEEVLPDVVNTKEILNSIEDGNTAVGPVK